MVTKDTHDGPHLPRDYRRLMLAALFPLLALVLQELFWEDIEPYVWFLFYPAVFFSSYVGGKWAGIAATAFSTLAVWWFFMPERFSFALERPMTFISLVTFFGMGLLFTLTHERLKQANLKAANALSLANAAKVDLEERISQRTADLAQTVDALRESESKYRLTLDSMLEGCQAIGFDWRYLYLNGAAERQNRRPNAELLGRSMLECWPDMTQTEAYAYMKMCMEERTTHRFETEYTFPDGNRGWYRVIIQPAKEGVVIFSEDITERKQAEQELKEHESKLSLILEKLPVGVWTVDAQGFIIQGNGAGQKIWEGARYVGIEEYDLYKGWWASTGKRIGPKEWAAARAITKGETSLNEEIDIECFDGSRKTILHSAVPLRDENEHITGAVVINQDITERKLAEAALAEKKRLLEELNSNLEQRVADAVSDLRRKDRILIQQSRQAALGEMIGNIAHQWRQPLNTLGLIVQELLLTYGRPEFTKEDFSAYVRKAMELIAHMSKTIDDFSTFFKPERVKTLFNIKQALAKTLSLIAPTLKNLDIVTDVVEINDIDVLGYPSAYSQVLLNILTNCRDAFEGRGQDGQRLITIRVFKEADQSVVTVADNAGGIQEGVMDRIFDPYFTTKEPGKGTGIGLYMAKTIIEKSMGGKLSVCNTATGAEFRIEVPLTRSLA